MPVRIGRFDYSECWDGVLYKALSDYPRITDWEIQTVLDFACYEAANGRDCPIEGEESVLAGASVWRRPPSSGSAPPAPSTGAAGPTGSAIPHPRKTPSRSSTAAASSRPCGRAV